jgi:hypothetical protein
VRSGRIGKAAARRGPIHRRLAIKRQLRRSGVKVPSSALLDLRVLRALRAKLYVRWNWRPPATRGR